MTVQMPINGYHTSEPRFTVLDEDDYERVRFWKWQEDAHGYARRNSCSRDENGCVKWKTVLLHRFLLGIVDSYTGVECVDHINGDTLDNRRKNLRVVTLSTNSSNRHIVISSSGELGVSETESGFVARASRNKVKMYLGVYPTAEAAAVAIKNFNSSGFIPEKKVRVRPVMQIGSDGLTINVFSNCHEASKECGIPASNIQRSATNNKYRAGGFLWRYIQA